MISFSLSSSSSFFLTLLVVLLSTYYFSCPCLSTRNLKGNDVGSESTTIWGSMVLGVQHKGGGDIYNLGGEHDDNHVASRMKLHEVNSGPNPISNSFPSSYSQSKSTATPSASSSSSSTTITTSSANYSHQTAP